MPAFHPFYWFVWYFQSFFPVSISASFSPSYSSNPHLLPNLLRILASRTLILATHVSCSLSLVVLSLLSPPKWCRSQWRTCVCCSIQAPKRVRLALVSNLLSRVPSDASSSSSSSPAFYVVGFVARVRVLGVIERGIMLSRLNVAPKCTCLTFVVVSIRASAQQLLRTAIEAIHKGTRPSRICNRLHRTDQHAQV